MAQPQTTHRNIKILSVVWYKVLPAKFGGQKAVALFYEHLGRFAEIVCLCSKNNVPKEASFKIEASLPVSKLQFLNPLTWIKIYNVAKREACTHLLLEFPYHGIAGIICKKLLKVKLIVNTHNIEYQRFKEQKKWLWAPLYYYERWTLKHCDAVFFKTVEDKTAGMKQFGLPEQKMAVIPYGAEEIKHADKRDAKRIIVHRHSIEEGKKILLFAGTLDYLPNADAVLSIVNKLIPLLDRSSFGYKVIICGRNYFSAFQYLKNLGNKHLVMAGEVADISSYFLAADVFINPVLMGGGVQTKTMDALSCHLNVVCFKSKQVQIKYAGNKIFEVEDGDWNAFAQAAIYASGVTSLTEKAFFTSYSWDAIAQTAYQKLPAL